MKARYQVKTVVFLCIFREIEGCHRVLLQLRQNTGYMDGKYDFAVSGHVESGESMLQAIIREAKEEADLIINPEKCIFLTFVDDTYERYHKGFFGVREYEGVPKVMEPDKCAGYIWADLNNLPKNIIPYLPKVLRNISLKIPYDDEKFSLQQHITNCSY